MQGAALRIEAIGGVSRGEFVDHVSERHLWMKGDVARAGAFARGDEKRIVRAQFPARGIEAEQEDPVEPQVGYRDESAARIEHGFVWMRARLSDAIRSRFALQVDQIAARPQRPVLLDRHHTDRAGAVIGGNDPAAARIDR